MENKQLIKCKKIKMCKEEENYFFYKIIFTLSSFVLIGIFISAHLEFFNFKSIAFIVFIISGFFMIYFRIKFYFKEKNKECKLYDIAEPKAKKIKILIQMAIGIGLATLIIIEMISLVYPGIRNIVPSKIDLLINKDILKMVSLGLGAATGIELAYMLFTDGPDEAVDPLIMGIAAFTLSQLSDNEFEIKKGIGIFFVVILIPILFFVKNKFLKDKKS